MMVDRNIKNSNGTSRRAQAIVELAVFGAIFLFIIAGIIQQGFSTMTYQQSQLMSMRQSLLDSYNSGMLNNPQKNVATVLTYEDRLMPGLFKYGSIDRTPFASSSNGSLSRNLYMPMDYGDFTATDRMPLIELRVNGQTFTLTTSAGYVMTASMTGGVVSIGPFYNPAATIRLTREWNEKCPAGGACYPWAYTVAARGNSNFTGDSDWQYDYNRNGVLTDDLWMQTSPNLRGSRFDSALWKWDRQELADVQSRINAKDGDYPTIDINGDNSEDTIFALTLPPPVGGTTSYSAQIVDAAAGETSYEDPTGLKVEERQGMRPDASVYTQMGDGTVLEIRNGRRYIPGTMELSRSFAMKSQLDVISRIYQLNPRMADPMAFWSRNSSVGMANVDCLGANVMNTCFDMNTKTLYIRSNIRDARGRKWVYRADNATEQALVGP